jgi:hypothetical protein
MITRWIRARRLLAATVVAGGVLMAGVGFAAPAWAPTNTPHSKADCKNGGWKHHTDAHGHAFKNQGQCVSWVEHNVNHHGK